MFAHLFVALLIEGVLVACSGFVCTHCSQAVLMSLAVAIYYYQRALLIYEASLTYKS